MPVAETIITIELDKPYKLYFNANTMSKYEEATGKNFLETVAKLYEAYKPMLDAQNKGVAPPADIASMEIVKLVPMSDLSALIWAGIHEYDAKDEPHWPLSLGQVRRMITIATIPELFLSFLHGQSQNSPSPAEMGESQAPPASPATGTTGAQRINGKADSGGERSIELPEGAFT